MPVSRQSIWMKTEMRRSDSGISSTLMPICPLTGMCFLLAFLCLMINIKIYIYIINYLELVVQITMFSLMSK